MKKILCTLTVMFFMSFSVQVKAQDEKQKEKDELQHKQDKKLKELDEKKQSEEIIIRKKGDKDTKINVEINGDKVIINGKPLSDFKDDNITINKRKIMIWDKNGSKAFDFDIPGEDFMKDFNWKSDGKEESYTFLGVSTDGVSADDNNSGAKISQVTKESAAEKAGLKTGDIITRINDKKIEGPESLSETVRTFKPKDEVTVYYKRDGKESSVKTTLGERKESRSMSFTFNTPEGMHRGFTIPRTPITPNIRPMPNMNMWENKDGENNFEVFGNMFPRQQKLGLKIQDTEDGSGVKVLDVEKDSPAEKAGLKKEDILTEVGGKKVSNTDEAREQLHENQDKSAYNIKGKRNGSEMNFDIRIPKKLKTANL